ncbi:MAG: aspartate--tRNA(Asn) ligase [Candidatus Diapherotrites archaeon]|nr:aspartate--tRNA(Asn) ligase [Candidatus Diapherotrites archaeon]
MERKYISEIKSDSGKVIVGGWVSELRIFGGIKFIVLRDRTGLAQIVLPKKEVSKELFDLVDSFSKESVILVHGLVKKAEQAMNGFEIVPEKIELISKAEAPIPLDISGKIESDLSSRLDWRFLDLRTLKNNALFKIRSKTFKAVIDYFDSLDFTAIQTPKITSAGVESGAELFEIKYFDKKAFLSQSPQIYKQMMVAAGFEKVYEIGPIFRAEKSHTTRHLTEFTGVDFEMGFIKDESTVMDIIEGMLKHIISSIKKECEKELKLFEVELIVPTKIPRIPIQEIRKMLKEKGKIIPENDDLDAEAEELLGKIVKEKFNSEFVFATNYPFTKRPFYHMKPENDSNGTRSFDLIWNGVEIATGAQREHRYEILKAQGKEKGVNLDEMKDYAAIFKYGCPPHGGVGFGLDRIVQRMLKLENIKEALLLPRDPERLNP